MKDNNSERNKKKEDAKIIIAGIFSIVVGLGISRFAFTSLLQEMLHAFLDIKTVGFLTSINYAGYLSGSIFAIFIQNMSTRVFLFRLGLGVSVVSVFTLGLTQNLLLWQLSRALSGVASAFVFVIGSGLVMSKLHMKDKTKAMGIHFSGIGFGIFFADVFVKFFISYFSWQQVWLGLGFFALLLSMLSTIPFTGQKQKNVTKHFHFDKSLFTPFVTLLILAYFAEGVGFVVQATFLPDIIDRVAPGYGSYTWLLVGLSAIFSCIVLMHLASHFGSINIIILAFILQVMGILIPTITNNIFLNILSGILYGGTFSGLVALFLHLGGIASKGNPVVLMGALTTSYGVGQVTAPLYSVFLVEIFESYNYALYLTAFIVTGGSLLIYWSKNFYKKDFSHE